MKLQHGLCLSKHLLVGSTLVLFVLGSHDGRWCRSGGVLFVYLDSIWQHTHTNPLVLRCNASLHRSPTCQQHTLHNSPWCAGSCMTTLLAVTTLHIRADIHYRLSSPAHIVSLRKHVKQQSYVYSKICTHDLRAILNGAKWAYLCVSICDG